MVVFLRNRSTHVTPVDSAPLGSLTSKGRIVLDMHRMYPSWNRPRRAQSRLAYSTSLVSMLLRIVKVSSRLSLDHQDLMRFQRCARNFNRKYQNGLGVGNACIQDWRAYEANIEDDCPNGVETSVEPWTQSQSSYAAQAKRTNGDYWPLQTSVHGFACSWRM